MNDWYKDPNVLAVLRERRTLHAELAAKVGRWEALSKASTAGVVLTPWINFMNAVLNAVGGGVSAPDGSAEALQAAFGWARSVTDARAMAILKLLDRARPYMGKFITAPNVQQMIAAIQSHNDVLRGAIQNSPA